MISRDVKISRLLVSMAKRNFGLGLPSIGQTFDLDPSRDQNYGLEDLLWLSQEFARGGVCVIALFSRFSSMIS